MTQACTALLVGGPANGTVMQVRSPHDAIFVPVFDYRHLSAFAADGGDSPPVDTVSQVIYDPTRIRLFRHVFPVWGLNGMTDDDSQDELLKLLLNDRGIGLLSEYA